MSYKIRRPNQNDKTQLFDLFVNGFTHDEPLLNSLLDGAAEEAINDSEKEIRIESCSLVFVENGKIVGATVSKVLEEDERDVMYTEIDNVSDKNVRRAIIKIQRFLDCIGMLCRISTHFPECKKGILIDKIYVLPSHRGRGIAKKLIKETMKLAEQNDCNYIKIVASNLFTVLAVESLGFERIYSIDYKDYTMNGDVVFKTEPPHTSLAVYLKKI